MPSTVEPPGVPTRPSRRLAALSAAGAVVIALPLVQVLRFQADELAAVRHERAGLDPMAHTVDVQRKVIGHRDLSSLVLRGQVALEPQRLQQQQAVDTAVAVLATDFASGLWSRARGESEALRDDWSRLKPEIDQRRISAAQSEAAHRLLVEHCLQITDDLADGLTLQVGVSVDATAKQLRQLRELPRELWRSAQVIPQTAAQQQRATATAALQLQGFAALHQTISTALAERHTTLVRQRAAVATAIAVLLFSACGLLLHLLRTSWAAFRTPPRPAPQAVLRERQRDQPEPLPQAVLQRMRAADLREAQDTLPPP